MECCDVDPFNEGSRCRQSLHARCPFGTETNRCPGQIYCSFQIMSSQPNQSYSFISAHINQSTVVNGGLFYFQSNETRSIPSQSDFIFNNIFNRWTWYLLHALIRFGGQKSTFFFFIKTLPSIRAILCNKGINFITFFIAENEAKHNK